jgi:hypothetical protein
VAVRTRRGPHVTPELFTLSGERIICLTAASTLKAELAPQQPIMGLAVRSAAGTLAAVCEAEVVDLADPTTFMASPRSALSSSVDVARFVRGNAAELAGAAADALWGRLGLPPKRRVVLALRLIAVATDIDGGVSDEGWDAIPEASSEHDAASSNDADAELDEDAVPPELQHLLGAGDAVLGWTRRDGTPLAIPGRWDGESATVARRLFEATSAAAASPASATFDTWTGFGPTGKQGVMLRGQGKAQLSRSTAAVSLEIDRATYWDGIETNTVEAQDAD